MMLCKYCGRPIDTTSGGFSMSEGPKPEQSQVMHDECWQQSGEDGGYVERMNRAIREMLEQNEMPEE